MVCFVFYRKRKYLHQKIHQIVFKYDWNFVYHILTGHKSHCCCYNVVVLTWIKKRKTNTDFLLSG